MTHQQPKAARGSWAMRDYPLVAWLLAALVLATVHRWIADADWLLLHIVLLGALTQGIVVWSWHFAQTLLHASDTHGGRRHQTWRLALLNAGAILVLVGVPTHLWWVTLVGAAIVALAAAWHGWALWRMLRSALPGRFRVSVHYYLGSAASLVLGAGLGTWLAFLDDGPLHGRVLVAHALTNTLGWVGLTLTGTLLTLWPTMLRTRMDERADRWTRRAFPIFAAALLVAVSGALLGWSWLAAGGVGVYLVGLAFWGRGLWGPVRRRRPSEFAPASVAAGISWLTIAVAWMGWILASTSDWPRIDDAFVWPAATLAIGLLQVLLGASSYLLPSVLGGGPSVVRAGQTWLNRWWLARVAVLNVCVLLWLLPTPSPVKSAAAILGIFAAALFVPLMIVGVRASLRARSALDAAHP
jgi:nitrite reductase (NO-forming)